MLAEFLLNPRLCPLRLHIEVEPDPRDSKRHDHGSAETQCYRPKFAHPGNLRRQSRKQTAKAVNDASCTRQSLFSIPQHTVIGHTARAETWNYSHATARCVPPNMPAKLNPSPPKLFR